MASLRRPASTRRKASCVATELHLRRHARQQSLLPHGRALRDEPEHRRATACEPVQRHARRRRPRRRWTFTFSALDRNTAYNFNTFDNDRRCSGCRRPPPVARADATHRGRRVAPVGAGAAVDRDWLGRTVEGDANSDSQLLLEATAPMRSDGECAAAYASSSGSDFHPASMVCAGTAALTRAKAIQAARCWSATARSWCSPGSRRGAAHVQATHSPGCTPAWVPRRLTLGCGSACPRHEQPSRIPPLKGAEAVTFAVTTSHPGVPAFTDLDWDFDSDGVVDASGANPSHTYPAAGQFVARVTATGSGMTRRRRRSRSGSPNPRRSCPRC